MIRLFVLSFSKLFFIAVPIISLFIFISSCSDSKSRELYLNYTVKTNKLFQDTKYTETDIDSSFIKSRDLLVKAIDSIILTFPNKQSYYIDSMRILQRILSFRGDSIFNFSQTDPAYNGVSWGLSYDDFAKVKSLKEQFNSDTTSEIIPRNAQINTALSVLLGASARKVLSNYGDMEVSIGYFPSKFITVFIDSEDVYYIFYSGRFAMAFTRLVAKNYNEYLNALSNKYILVKSFTGEAPSPEQQPDKLMVDLFKKGKIIVFLVRIKRDDLSMGMSYTSLGALYIHKDYLDYISRDINNVNRQRVEQQEESIKKQTNDDLHKLQ